MREGREEMPIECVAHRGFSGIAPENTMSAIELALAEPYVTWIEVDVQLSKDGVPFLIHDYTLNRTTNGRGPVKDYTWEELRQLDAGRWKSKRYAGERLVSLDDFLEVIKGRLRANIELKSQGNMYPGLENKVIDTIGKHRMEHDVVLTSFEPRVLAKVKELRNKIRTGLIIEKKPKDLLLRLQLLQCSFLSLKYRELTAELAAKAARRGVETMVWTVDNPRNMTRLGAMYEDLLICTNRPDVWNRVFGKHGGTQRK